MANNDPEVPFWDSDADALKGKICQWDQCYVNSVLLPGLVFPTVKPKRKVDKQTARALNSGNVLNLGQDIVEIQLKHRIWNEEDWQTWNRIKKNIDPAVMDDKLQRKMSIAHPSLADVGVTLVYFHARSNFVSTSNEYNGGMKECTWDGFVLQRPTAVKKENIDLKGAKQLPDVDVVDQIKNAQPPQMPSAAIFGGS